MKNAILEQHRIARIQSEIADFRIDGIDPALGNEEWSIAQVAAARHQGHAAIRLVKIGQAVTDLDSHARQTVVTKISGNPNVAMPSAPKRRRARALRTFVDQSRRMQMNIRTQQLYSQ